MVKFRTPDDKAMFLMEVGKAPTDQDTPQDHHLFVKRRKLLGNLYKDFQRSQQSKRNWDRNRFTMETAIRRYAHSPEGRRFHRQLGRFISTRNFIPKEGLLSLANEDIRCLKELVVLLQEEMEFYLPTHEYLFLECLIDEILGQLKIQ